MHTLLLAHLMSGTVSSTTRFDYEICRRRLRGLKGTKGEMEQIERWA